MRRTIAFTMVLSFVTTNVIGALPQLLFGAVGLTLAQGAAAASTPSAGPLPLPVPNSSVVGNPLPTESASTTAMGVTPGGFAVSPNGTATYSIPLRVPEGRAGYTPSLAINFDSASGSASSGWDFHWRRPAR